MSTYLRAKRSWVALIAVAGLIALAFPATSFGDQAGGCDFAPNGTTPNCAPPLSPSKFEGGDGNLVVNTTGNKDWSNISGLHTGVDLASGHGDNAFGQGTKEDNANVTIVNGSIPPNKSDLSRFYQASETVGSGASAQTFLYLAWERTNVLGSANMDFEINQKATAGFTGSTTGAITLNRTPGDMLITFDFTNGGGKPTLGLNRWLTGLHTPDLSASGFASNACLASQSFPCWGDHVTLNGSVSEGAVNNLGSVYDPILGSDVGTNRFGEAAINLTGAGVFGTGSCISFASTFLKSRAAASFPAEVKDFVAPVPTSISNCGEVKIIKHTDPRGLNAAFGYTSTLAGSEISCTSDTTPAAFSLNDNGNTTGNSAANTEDCLKVPAGSYTVTEGAPPAGFTLESLSCTATTGSSGSQDATTAAQANITLLADGVVTCTYVNQQQLGAIKITKTDSKTGNALAGATFSIKSGGNPISGSPFTTDSNGVICADGLAFGDYSVKETGAPKGYVIDDSRAHTVTVNNNASCSDATYVGESISFTDTPTSDIQVRFRDGGSGVTSGTISCDNSTGTTNNSATTGWDASKLITGISAPVTVTCTITIDP